MKKPELLLVRGAAQIVTLRGPNGPRRGPALSDLSIVENGAILIRDGVIEHVGPAHRIENLDDGRRARELDASGCVILPGFVDSHTHLVHAQPRLADDVPRSAPDTGGSLQPAGVGVASTVEAVRTASPSRLKAHAQQVLSWMAAHGTTTAESKSGYGLDEAGETRILRLTQVLNGSPIDLIPTAFASQMVPPPFAGDPDAYMQWWAEFLLPLIARRKLARFADVLCDPEYYSLRAARAYLEAARAAGLPLRLHVPARASRGAVQLAIEMMAVSVDHLDSAGNADIDALAGSGTIATLIPAVAFHSDSGRRAPARALIDSGAAIALASGFDAGSPCCSMPVVLSLACSMLRMSAAEAISAATINGAGALLCADRIGSLEAGKDADFIVAAVRDYRELPYYFGVQTISRVFKRGVEITAGRN